MPGLSNDMFAQIQARNNKGGAKAGGDDNKSDGNGDAAPAAKPKAPSPAGMAINKNARLMASLQKRLAPTTTTKSNTAAEAAAAPVAVSTTSIKKTTSSACASCPEDKLFIYDKESDAFLFHHPSPTNNTGNKSQAAEPRLQVADGTKKVQTIILVPLAPCIYRLLDYTLAKKKPIQRSNCINKLGVLRCLQRECLTLNNLVMHRVSVQKDTMEEEELGKTRFMELLSNCGVYQKVSELLLQRIVKACDEARARDGAANAANDNNGSTNIPQIQVEGLNDFLQTLEQVSPMLKTSRLEIKQNQMVSFYPGLGELFLPGSQLVTYPDGMDGIVMGCSCVQSWYTEDLNQATGKIKRRFILVVEFLMSVGTELVFVAASEVYPEFHDCSRSMPLKDLTHRKLMPEVNAEDAMLLKRLQQRGMFYASVATKNHYLEYTPHSFFPIMKSNRGGGGGGWSSHNNAVRPLSKGGRVMVDVHRGILEGHLPLKSSGSRSADGMSDTVKEAIKLFDQNKRTGIAVPFRTAILPDYYTGSGAGTGNSNASANANINASNDDYNSDSALLWQAWPCLVGFSFTSRVWGKLLLTLPKADDLAKAKSGIASGSRPASPSRACCQRLGVEIAGLGGMGASGSCGYIQFQEQAFDQLVLADDKKELIRAVARNAGGGDDSGEDDSDDDDDMGLDMDIDVVANKGAASIFLLHGPPGCGKTLTAEAIAELLQKPLYVVTAGDLGITANEVEQTLGSVLELCQTWDALVLVDEADIFLEKRQSHEIQRNALVCVMLRLLEYYSGCLFLSSNVSSTSNTIDAAIASRITVMLSYPPLDVAGRAKVWKNLIGLVPVLPEHKTNMSKKKASKYRVGFSDTEYQELAIRYQINGRQIKNSLVLARALSRERGVPLDMQVLQRAVTAVAGEGLVTSVHTTSTG
jgi:hypothetical protein